MVASKPQFSVVVPAYNRAGTIRATLDSLVRQTHVDWECIVVDDGSADGPQLAEVVKSYSDSRFRYVRQDNAGGGAARNTGVTEARGSFIAFLDSDDLFLPTKLEVYAGVVDESARNAYYSPVLVRRKENAYWIRPDRLILPGESVADYLFVFNQFIQTSSIVLSRSLAIEVPFDPTLRKGQDLDLCVRLHNAGVGFVGIPEPLAIWVDETEENRTSRHGGAQAPQIWLEKNKEVLGKRATYGYRATVLAYYVAQERPFTALHYLVSGLIQGRVPAKIIARQFMRCYLPRAFYRRLVDRFVQAYSRRSP